MNERRRHKRTVCRLTACVEKPGMVKADRFCRTGNIGMKGAFLTNIPQQPLGSSCTLVFHDKDHPLKLSARVTHLTAGGVGFTFSNPKVEECLRLKHLVKPHWDGKDFLEGILLMLRYSEPTTELKDCLALTTFLSNNPQVFVRQPHTECSLPVTNLN